MGFDMSWKEIMSIVEAEGERNPEYLLRVRMNHGPLFSDMRAKGDGDLLADLHLEGLCVDKELMRRFVPETASAQDLVGRFQAELGVALSDEGEERAWMALCILWERWFVEHPSAEMLDDYMQRGYDLIYDNGYTPESQQRGLAEWRSAWAAIKRLARVYGVDSVEGFDDLFCGTQSLFNWWQDYEMELDNAAIDDPARKGERERFLAELRELFPGESSETRFAAVSEQAGKRVKVGRNEPCPCGSGKKYKRCCGA